ncbi:protein PYRICULARIA ORYZAE RESISTANCE 21-like [Belonocnema kinseyi]|uniref:protein PYRICULARIA ORYZAE RESISTANCE 21-like n=1 Tax=Belonocnema kinseyi TaxID=2817044 RepID=UPI00143CC6AE|nr:protein PYRICULARIA ORYZAE RESISTANCE 21-like [Belonocnema kinseyi]
MAKLLRGPSVQLANILRFMSSGKQKSSGPTGCNNKPSEKKPDPCKEKPDPCQKNPDPCEKKSDSSAKKPDPFAKNPDPCDKKPDPCAKKPDPCEKKPGPCAKKPDPCEKKPGPCENKPDPCAKNPDPCNKILDATQFAIKDNAAIYSKKSDCASSEKNYAPGIDLSNPCGGKSYVPPSVPPKESCHCDEPAMEFCPVTEKMKARMKFWQFASLFGAIPAVGLALTIILPASHESKKKPRDEYVNYSYMHRITKPYWWGDGHHGIFHNPVVNPIPPNGYEVPDPYAVDGNKEGDGKH